MEGNKTSQIAIQFRQFPFSFSSTTIHQQEASVRTVPVSPIFTNSPSLSTTVQTCSIKMVCFEVGSSLSQFVAIIMVCRWSVVFCGVYNVNILMTRKQIISHLIILPSMDPVSLRHWLAGCWVVVGEILRWWHTKAFCRQCIKEFAWI